MCVLMIIWSGFKTQKWKYQKHTVGIFIKDMNSCKNTETVCKGTDLCTGSFFTFKCRKK